MANTKATKLLVTAVAIYGGYRLIKSTQQRKLPSGQRNALPQPQQPQRFALPNPAQQQIVDWRAAGTPQRIQGALQEALQMDGQRINSFNELVYAACARLWPGVSIHPSGVAAVRNQALDMYSRPGSEADLSAEYRDAHIRMLAKKDRMIADARQVYDGSVETSVLIDTVVGSMFPEQEWPPAEGDPAWKRYVWDTVRDTIESQEQEGPQKQVES